MKKFAFKKLAEMSTDDLQIIYELTYKYGWLVAEERQEGWLPDKAYLEKAKIEGELNPWIDYGLGELEETYTDYIYNHTVDGWAERWMEMYEGTDLETLLEGLKGWAKRGVSAVSEREIEQQFLESIFEIVGDDYREDPYQALGPQFIETHIEEMTDVEDQEKMEEKWKEAQGAYSSPEEIAEDFIYQHDFDKEFQEYVKDTDYGTVNWFLDMYSLSDALYQFPNLVDNGPFYRNLFFNSYVKNFPGLEDTVEEVERVKSEIDSAKASDISNKIITFQLGLNTAHQFGSMADHLLETGTGSGQKILDEISSGPNVARWDKDLEQIIGFKSPTEQIPEYFTPASKLQSAVACMQTVLSII